MISPYFDLKGWLLAEKCHVRVPDVWGEIKKNCAKVTEWQPLDYHYIHIDKQLSANNFVSRQNKVP